MRIDPTTDPRLGLRGWSQPTKHFKKIFEVLIVHMKKLKNNPYEYELYML